MNAASPAVIADFLVYGFWLLIGWFLDLGNNASLTFWIWVTDWRGLNRVRRVADGTLRVSRYLFTLPLIHSVSPTSAKCHNITPGWLASMSEYLQI